MTCMKFSRFVKSNAAEIVFLVLIAVFFYLYFVVYMTPSKSVWYVQMYDQINAFYFEITHIGN